MKEKSKSKYIIYLDNCLVNYEGHSATFALSLLQADSELKVLSNKRCILNNPRISPTFQMTFGDHRLALPDITKGWYAYVTLVWRLIYANFVYFLDLYRAKKHWHQSKKQSSVIIVANAESRCSFAIILLAALYPHHRFILYFQRGSQNIFKLVRLFLHLLRLENVHFVAETSEMAESWACVLGVRCATFPFPVEPKTSLQMQAQLPNRVITFGVLGPPRYEKGFDIILQACQKLYAESWSSHVRFIVQIAPVCSDCEVDTAVKEFRVLATQYPNIQLIENSLPDDEYAAVWHQIDVAVLPYRCSAYSLRSSGVLIEAITNGKPIIVTTDTLLAQVARKHASVVEIPNEDACELIVAIEETLRQFNELQVTAVELASRWRKQFGPSSFLEFVCAI